MLAHGQALYGELLRVPLIVQFPDGEPGRDPSPASTLDIVPTVLAAAGIDVPPELPGRVLGEVAPRGRSEPPVRVAQHHHTMRSVQSDGYKLIESVPDDAEQGLDVAAPARVQLFHVARDLEETVDVAEQEAAALEGLRGRLERYLEQWRAPRGHATASDMDAEDIAQLRALGYLGDG